jgi:uracil-DNA glycosylase
MEFDTLRDEIAACRICAGRFAATATAHEPRPVFWAAPGARILVAGQAPGMRVHESGRPFTDPSGDRLRDWMGVDAATFYDRSRIAILPMAFCFPGLRRQGRGPAATAYLRRDLAGARPAAASGNFA